MAPGVGVCLPCRGPPVLQPLLVSLEVAAVRLLKGYNVHLLIASSEGWKDPRLK